MNRPGTSVVSSRLTRSQTYSNQGVPMTSSQVHQPIDGHSDFVEDLESLTPTVLASYARIEDERLRELVTAAISHLHAFVREVNLSNQEWRQALDFVNALGRGG